MTIQSEISKVTYIADGYTTNFSIPFYFFNNEVAVYKNDSITPLTQISDYTIINNNSTGEVILNQTPQKDDKITIIRDVELKQQIQFIEGEKFPAKDYENSLDKIIMALQQFKEKISHMIKTPTQSSITGEEFYEIIKNIDKEFDVIRQIPEIALKTKEIYHKIEEIKPIKYTNVVLDVSTITTDTTYIDYGHKVDIPLSKATTKHTPSITLKLEDITKAIFAPIAEAFDGYVRLYLKSVPTTDITIPVILLY